MSLDWTKERVLITGGTGFLGYHLTKQLCTLGAQVKTFAQPTRSDHPLKQLPVESIVGDIRDRDAVGRAANNCDVIFHTAGTVAVWGPALKTMQEIHVEGTRNVIAAAGKTTRIVHTSSIVAAGATRYGAVLNENSPFNLAQLRVDYVQAKRTAEQVALHAATEGHDVIVVNPGYLIGPEDYEPSIMGKFCERVWKGKMPLAAPGGYNLVDVRDAARGHILAAERGQSGRRYILGGENRFMAEFMRELFEVAGMKPRGLPRLPISTLWLAALIAELRSLKSKREPYPSFQHVRLNRLAWFVSSDRAKAELGYDPRPLNETIRDMHNWFKREHEVRLKGMKKWWLRPAA